MQDSDIAVVRKCRMSYHDQLMVFWSANRA